MSMELGSSGLGPRLSWWSSQSPKEQKLILVSGILSGLVVIFLVCTIVLGVKGKETEIIYVTGTTPGSTTSKDTETTPDTQTGDVCKSEVCKRTAFEMKMNMDTSVKPCDDFYRFSCGGFPAYRGEGTSAATVAGKRLIDEVKAILLLLDAEKQSNIATWSAIKLYEKCIQRDETGKDEGIEELKNLIREILGSDWPMAVQNKWKESSFDWIQSIARAMKMDPQFLIRVLVGPDIENTKKSALYFGPAQSKYEKPGDLKKIICTVLTNCSSLTPLLDEEIKKLSTLTSEGYFYSKPNSTSQDHSVPYILRSSTGEKATLKKYNLKNLNQEMPEVNWLQFFRTVMEDKDITEDFEIISEMSLLKLIFNVVLKDKRNLANGIAVNLIYEWGQLYSFELRKTWNVQTKTQEETCFKFVNSYLGFAVGKMYIDLNLPADQLREITESTLKVKEGFRDLVVNADWLDKSTKDTALKKVDKMVSLVASPQWVHDDEELEKRYQKLRNVNSVSFLSSSRTAARNLYTQEILQLKKPFALNNYWPTPSAVEMNAFYSHNRNSMIFPFGFLQSPFFAPGRPRAVTYGYFGYVSGHEITHGFDSNGKEFDENGVQNDWWDAETKKKFEEEAQCFIDQYSKIKDKLTGLQLNGTHTLAENIADNGGIRAAYQAYKKAPVKKESKLIGFETFTEDQLFFLASAQNWCNSATKDWINDQIKSDNHSPDMYRVLVPFQNFYEFGKAFNCEAGSKMNPIEKCRIW